MGKLWCFGDSFTAGDGCIKLTNGYQPSTLLYREWLNLKEDEEIPIWPVIVANHFNLELKNFGSGGWGHESILDSFFKNVKNIGPDDYVIIGLSYAHRFDGVLTTNINKSMQTFSINRVMGENEEHLQMSNLSKEGLLQIIYNRNEDEFIERLCDSVHAIKHMMSFICKKCIIWGIDNEIIKYKPNTFLNIIGYKDIDQFKATNDISNETNFKVIDGHFGMNGHKLFAEMVISDFTFEKKLI
jgi:hypothetical protein